MIPYDFKMELWTLNEVYNKVKNCRVVKPPYESDWYYSNKFFLDKRLDLESIYSNANRKFLDTITIKWIDYYLYREWSKHYIWTFDWTTFTNVTTDWFVVDSDSPIKLVYGKWIYWPRHSTHINSEVSSEMWWWVEFPLIPWYAWWYIKFWYSTWTRNLNVWDFILFKEWALTWWINRIEYMDWVVNGWSYAWSVVPVLWVNDTATLNWQPYIKDTVIENVWSYTLIITNTNWSTTINFTITATWPITWENIYIIWTNIRWTIPETWTSFESFKAANCEVWTTLVVWHSTWLDLIVLNWSSQAFTLRVLTTNSEPIIDAVNFDWNIFALTRTHMYFSRSTFNDNTQFYPLDYYYIDWWYKLFPIWKALLAFGRQNKLFAAANSTWTNVWYVWYDVNYNWDLFSKYSFIFDDQTIYILQKDKELKQIDIVQNNTTTFDLKVTDVLVSTRWLFNILDWWEVLINSNQRFLNFLYKKSWNTINYQYDKMYRHFIENEYNKEIYYFWEKILSNWNIYIENWIGGYTQEVNFMIDTLYSMQTPSIIRTLFWMSDTALNINLDTTLEIGWTIDIVNKVLTWFKPDLRLTWTITWDELLEDTEPNEASKYNWNIMSIQSNIEKTWRFINFKYHWTERFILWPSLVITKESRTFVNEPLLTN